MKAAEYYNNLWSEKIESKANNMPNRIKEALNEIHGGGNVLDIGCGDGALCQSIVDRFDNVYGIDNSKVALRSARDSRISTTQVDLDKGSLPFLSQSFDMVTCLDVIEHLFDPVVLVKEIHRVLKPDGFFVLTTPNIRFIDFVKRLLIDGRFPKTSLDKGVYHGGHLNYFTFKDLRLLLSQNGFIIIVDRGYDEKQYSSLKVMLFKIITRIWEKETNKEFFCPGILLKGQKISE
jgi:methionine biosynthesis protein MetW